MIKLSIDELDTLIKAPKVADVPENGTTQEVNPVQTSENSTKPPLLRKPIDAVIGAAAMVGAGAAAGMAGLAKLRTDLPLKEVD